MSIQTPATAEEVRQALRVGRPFVGTRVHADRIAVLSGALRSGPELTGPLAGEVVRTMADYTEQYLTDGGRERPWWHVVYYATARDPENAGARRVLARLASLPPYTEAEKEKK